jgi:hypothetical protein
MIFRESVNHVAYSFLNIPTQTRADVIQSLPLHLKLSLLYGDLE